MDELETRTQAGCVPEVREADGDKPAGIKGYGYKWGDVAELAGGMITERILKGAFRDSLKRADVKLMIGHDHHSLPLARSENGTFRVSEDDMGLRFDADIDEADPDGASLMRKVRSGLADKMSVGFTMRNGGVEKRIEPKKKGDPIEYVIERVGELMEISVVSWPAYDRTEVSARRRAADLSPEPDPEGVRRAIAQAEPIPPQADPQTEPDEPVAALASPLAVAQARARGNVRLCGILAKQLARHVDGESQ